MDAVKIDRYVVERYPGRNDEIIDIFDRLHNERIVTIQIRNKALREALAYKCLMELNRGELTNDI